MTFLRTVGLVLMTSSLVLTGCESISNLYQNEDHMQSTDAHNMDHNKGLNKANITDYKWQLHQATDSQGQSITALNEIKDDVTMTFRRDNGEDFISFSGNCNMMGGHYTLSDHTLVVGHIQSTLMLCQGSETADRILVNAMQGQSILSYESGERPRLQQKTDEGQTLIWQGTKTAKAKYNQSGETVFWEVDPQLQPCPNVMFVTDSDSCLKVREVQYDAQGIKTGTGDWVIFTDSIEGYKHDSSIEQIIRLKRYDVDPADIKGKNVIYEFERIVESSIRSDQ